MLNLFTKWMEKNTALSETSIYKYTRAVSTISKEMLALGIISKSLLDMDIYEIDFSISVINKNSHFLKNKKGNSMYSNSLKQYRYFYLDTEGYKNEVNLIPLDIASLTTTQRDTVIKSRIGQGLYRKNLITKYSSKCILTGIDNKNLLIASHIKPWSVCNNNERIDIENGLLLSATMDRLFDCGLITFNNSGKLYISSFVGNKNEARLHISNTTTVDLLASSNLLEYLQYHRDVLFIR